MTTDEITALRKEFEDAILTACGDFKQLTGVAVEAIYLSTQTLQQIGMADEVRVTQVHIRLESL